MSVKVKALGASSVLFLTALAIPSVHAANNVAVGFQAGTFGLGPIVSYSLTDTVNLRAMLSKYTFKDDNLDMDDVDYDAELEWGGLSGFVDWHPFRGNFRVTAGLVKSSSEITGEAEVLNVDPEKTIDIGDETYFASDFTSLGLSVDFKKVNPYLGIGWGYQTQETGLGIAFDLGLMMMDSPGVDFSYNAIDAIEQNPLLAAELRRNISREERAIEDDAGGFDYFPFISLGINYAFSF